MIRKFGVLGANFGTAPNLVRLLERIGHEARIIGTKKELAEVDALVIPGVGSYDVGIDQLHSLKLFDEVLRFIDRGKPTVGVCLGMQLLCASSKEGSREGLGFFPLEVERLDASGDATGPHIGWNELCASRGDSERVLGESLKQYFYFSHSYGVPVDPRFTLAETEHKARFSSIISHKNVVGIQFHPEKSHRNGLDLMKMIISHLEVWFA